MDDIRQYALSVTAAAVFCGILSSLLTESKTKTLIHLVFGIFLSIAVIRPFTNIDISCISEFPSLFSDIAQPPVADGENMAELAVADIIKEETEAYILDKAAELNADIQAEIILSDDDPPVPFAAKLYGKTTPYVRRQLQIFLQSELGISKENQQWSGEP